MAPASRVLGAEDRESPIVFLQFFRFPARALLGAGARRRRRAISNVTVSPGESGGTK